MIRNLFYKYKTLIFAFIIFNFIIACSNIITNTDTKPVISEPPNLCIKNPELCGPSKKDPSMYKPAPAPAKPYSPPLVAAMPPITGSAGGSDYNKYKMRKDADSLNRNNPNLLYRAFLLPENSIKTELTTFVYFPRKPITSKEKEQYVNICKVWLNLYSTKSEVLEYTDIVKTNLVPIYWPLARVVTNGKDCSVLIDNYDYARAQSIMNESKLRINKTKLVAIYKDVAAVMSIHAIQTDEDLITAFNAWTAYMCEVPLKSQEVSPFTIVDSFKKVIGALSSLVSTKQKSS